MRQAEWLERLTAYLTEIRSKPFHPTDHNCGVFILGVIEAVRGDSAQEVLAQVGVRLPATEFGVKRLLAERGDMCGLATAYFGCPPEAGVLNACRGDIVVMDGNGGDTLGVVDNGAVIALTPRGLERHPIRNARGYWRL